MILKKIMISFKGYCLQNQESPDVILNEPPSLPGGGCVGGGRAPRALPRMPLSVNLQLFNHCDRYKAQGACNLFNTVIDIRHRELAIF